MNDEESRELDRWLAGRFAAFTRRDSAEEQKDALALAMINRDKAARIDPQIVVRCEGGCCLFKAWNHPNALLIWHPKVRLSVATRRDLPMRYVVESRLHVGAHEGGPEDTHVYPERAYAWAGKPIPLICRHPGVVGKSLSAEAVTELLSRALRTGKTSQEIAVVS